VPTSCEEGRLFSAAASGDLDEVKRLVLDCGVDPKIKDILGRTPLHHAASNGHLNVVEFLLEHGADPNIGDKNGNTPLHYAASGGHLDVVKLLRERGSKHKRLWWW
jgi:ankyrin repeat protein